MFPICPLINKNSILSAMSVSVGSFVERVAAVSVGPHIFKQK